MERAAKYPGVMEVATRDLMTGTKREVDMMAGDGGSGRGYRW